MDDLLIKAFEAIPSPVFVVDKDVRIHEYNKAAAALLNDEKSEVLRMRGGEALHCLHHHAGEGGCGTNTHCADCVVRNSVIKAFQGNNIVRSRQKMELVRDGQVIEIFLLVTSSPFAYQETDYAILVLEDISELVELRSIIPICSSCKQIRNDENYWVQVESYFRDHLDIEFTHGLCPSCRDKYLEELAALKQNA